MEFRQEWSASLDIPTLIKIAHMPVGVGGGVVPHFNKLKERTSAMDNRFEFNSCSPLVASNNELLFTRKVLTLPGGTKLSRGTKASSVFNASTGVHTVILTSQNGNIVRHYTPRALARTFYRYTDDRIKRVGMKKHERYIYFVRYN